MTVGLAIMYFYDHGITRRDFRDLALELKRRGHRVVIFSSRWNSEMIPDIRHVRLPAKGWSVGAKLRDFGCRISRRDEESKADCLVAFSRIPGADFYYVGEHAAQNSWKKQYGIRRFLYFRYWSERALEKKLFSSRSKTRIWALGRSQIDAIRANYGTPPERFRELPVGVSSGVRRLSAETVEKNRRNFREKFHVSPDETVCAIKGSKFRSKGIDRAITALSYLPDEMLRKTRLVICGKGAVARMDAFARHCNVRDRVIFQEDMSDEYLFSASDLVLVPSRNGVFDTIPLDAIVYGVPVAVTEKYFFSDFLTGRGGVVLPETFHCSDWVNFLRKFLDGPEMRDHLKREIEAFDPSDLFCRAAFMADRIEESMHD